jgi:hypothetical protein
VHNSYITILSTAFANAGAFRSIWIVVMGFVFGRMYKEGFEFGEGSLEHVQKQHQQRRDSNGDGGDGGGGGGGAEHTKLATEDNVGADLESKGSDWDGVSCEARPCNHTAQRPSILVEDDTQTQPVVEMQQHGYFQSLVASRIAPE